SIKMEFPSRQPFFCANFDSLTAGLAHMGMDWTVSKTLCLERIIHQFLDGVAYYTFNSHDDSLLFYTDGGNVRYRTVLVAAVGEEYMDGTVFAKRLPFMAEFE